MMTSAVVASMPTSAAVVSTAAACTTAAAHTGHTTTVTPAEARTASMISVARAIGLAPDVVRAFGAALVPPIWAGRRIITLRAGGFAGKVADRGRTGGDNRSDQESCGVSDWHGRSSRSRLREFTIPLCGVDMRPSTRLECS
jgi:hypothetical protein